MIEFAKVDTIGDRFKLNEVIGKGTFGVVYKANDLDNDSKVCAVKLVPIHHKVNAYV